MGAVFACSNRPGFLSGMRAPAAAAALGSLGACSPQAQDTLARDAARSTIAPVVAERLPGIPVQRALDCIIDNASAVQTRALAADAVFGATESSIRIVTEIAGRPDTRTCLGRQALPALR
jgi:hypothetical protein